MKRIKVALGSAIVIFVATPPVLGFAQWNGAAVGITRHVAGAPAMAGRLAPAEIATEVRRAGFEPISHPVQRGRVYVLFARDRDDVEVELTVHAGNGRVLWINDRLEARHDGSRYYGYQALSRYERPPVPPRDIPAAGPTWSNWGSFRSKASPRRSPPLPRTRPADIARGAAKETAPPAQGEPRPVTSGRSEALPAAVSSRPAPPTMVPVAPLE